MYHHRSVIFDTSALMIVCAKTRKHNFQCSHDLHAPEPRGGAGFEQNVLITARKSRNIF